MWTNTKETFLMGDQIEFLNPYITREKRNEHDTQGSHFSEMAVEDNKCAPCYLRTAKQIFRRTSLLNVQF